MPAHDSDALAGGRSALVADSPPDAPAPSLPSPAHGLLAAAIQPTTERLSPPRPERKGLCFTYALSGASRTEAENALRTALAALAIAGVVEQRERGYDLRSRSFLIPEDGRPLRFELVPPDGGEGERYAVSTDAAAKLVAGAAAAAAACGFAWEREPMRLVPAPKLSDLIRESRRRALEGDADEATE